MSVVSLIANGIAIDKNCIPRRQKESCVYNYVDEGCADGVCSKTTSDALYGLSIIGLLEIISVFTMIFVIVNVYLKSRGYTKLVALNIIVSLTFTAYNIYNNASIIDIYNNKLDNEIKTGSIVYIILFIIVSIYVTILLIFVFNTVKKDQTLRGKIKSIIHPFIAEFRDIVKENALH